jgi:hypothetical protein
MKLNTSAIAQIVAGIGAAAAIGAAPVAAAATHQTCINLGTSTQCQTPGRVQISSPVQSSGAPSGSTYGPFFTYDGGGR